MTNKDRCIALQQRWWEVACKLAELIQPRIGEIYDLADDEDPFECALHEHIVGLFDHGHSATVEEQPFVDRLHEIDDQIHALGGWVEAG